MTTSFSTKRTARRRRAVVAVQVLVSMTMLLGFAAFTIDIGTLYRARDELQTAADSAAMAAASAYTTDAMLQVRLGTSYSTGFADVVSMAAARANQFANLNATLGSPTLVEPGDITTGWIDPLSSTSPINPGVQPAQYNAVRVVVRREGEGGEGSNGPVEFYFAPIFGRLTGDASASAAAMFDDRFAGYDVDPNGAGVMPFAVHEDVFDADLAGGGDQYGYDSDFEEVTSGPDGIREVKLYPYDLAPGNFGLLNIGTPNQGVPGLRNQIENGVSPEDMEAEVGTSELLFFDADGDPVAYQITGDPGMKTELESSVEDRVGDVIAFFLHNGATGSGENSIYNITSIRFGQVMGVRLTGPPSQRGMWLQPVSYSGAGAQVSASAPSSNGLVGRMVLAR